MWEQKQRRAYLKKMNWDGATVDAASDEWVVMMTSHLAG